MRGAGASTAGWQSNYARWLALTDLIAVVAAVEVNTGASLTPFTVIVNDWVETAPEASVAVSTTV
jgi:hypothetical protein